MGSNTFDIALRQRILKYLEAGHGYKTIARDLGISVYSAKHIRDLYRRGNLDYFNGVDKQTQYDDYERLAVIHQFLESGLPLKTFARESCMNRNTLRNWVRKYREDSQHSFDGNHERLRIKACEKEALVKQFLHSGISLKAFAQKSGIESLNLKRWVQKYSGEDHHSSADVNKYKRREDSEKLALVDAFLASGVSLPTFAKSAGINYSTFRTWIRKYQEGTLKK